MEDIGARRLHTVIERVIEDISFGASERAGEKIVVTKELVGERLSDVVQNQDLARYILWNRASLVSSDARTPVKARC